MANATTTRSEPGAFFTDRRHRSAVALLLGALAMELLVQEQVVRFYYTPLIVGLTYLGAAAASRKGALWAPGIVTSCWGIAVLLGVHRVVTIDGKLSYEIAASSGWLSRWPSGTPSDWPPESSGWWCRWASSSRTTTRTRRRGSSTASPSPSCWESGVCGSCVRPAAQSKRSRAALLRSRTAVLKSSTTHRARKSAPDRRHADVPRAVTAAA